MGGGGGQHTPNLKYDAGQRRKTGTCMPCRFFPSNSPLKTPAPRGQNLSAKDKSERFDTPPATVLFPIARGTHTPSPNLGKPG